MIRNQKESAVSEVIAITLIVGLTVIMAALVAAYMFGMVPTIPVTRTLAYTADQANSNTITIVYHGGPDASSLMFARVNVTESGGAVPLYVNSTGHGSNIFGNKVGSVMTITAVTPNGFAKKQDHIVITGVFANNKEQVVLDTYI